MSPLERPSSTSAPKKGILCVSVQSGPHPHKGIVREARYGELSVEFVSEPPLLSMGKGLDLTLSGMASGDDYTAPARVTGRTDRSGVIQYTFQFQDPAQASRRLPDQLRADFNKKRHRRAPWPKGDPVSVTVLATEGAKAGTRILAKLLTLTDSGLCLLVNLAAEEALAASPTVVCTYRPAGREEPVLRPCAIQTRQLEGKQVVYLLSFTKVRETPDSAPTNKFEAMWDCPECGSKFLLGQSHKNCPECGRARQVPTYFPNWEDSKQTSEHWATGDDRECVFCSAAFSDLAEFCGRCGKPLP